MSQIRWLHLSDFHVGKDNYGQRKLFSEIIELVRQRIEEGFSLDFVFLTGDLANKGLQLEYEEFFDSFFIPLVTCLGGDGWGGKIYSIPGNHDVERERAKFFSPEEIIRTPERVFDPTAEGRIQRDQFIGRFGNYTSNEATNSPDRWIASDMGSFSKLVSVRGQKIGIAGINTAWLSKNDLDRHLLTPGSNILEDSLSKLSEASIRIVLGHHPMNWLADQEAKIVQTILAKHKCIYLHGHLHENEARSEDGGGASFLAIQAGAAFQGRSEDRPRWVNGLVWAELDLSKNTIALQPNHWSALQREWKVSSEAFPNIRRREGEDWWEFPVPGFAPVKPKEEVRSTTEPVPDTSSGSISVRGGWAFVDRAFVEARSDRSDPNDLLQFFDGRPPNWRLATSAHVPRRAIVDYIFNRLNGIEDASKPTIVNVIGAGGEGKSTAFFQVAAKLVSESNWVCLWRSNDTQQIDIETIDRLSKQFTRVIVAIDEAHSSAEWLPALLVRMKRLAKRNVHFLLCTRSIDWRAVAGKVMNLITRDSDYQEISMRGLTEDDAKQIVDAWSVLGKEGLRNLHGLDREAAAAALHKSASSQEVEEDEGAFLGAMLRSRYGDSLKDKIRSILYRLKDIEAPGGTLLEAYAMIAAMHNEGLRFLSLQVLAEALGCSFVDARRKIINPLADEAMAAGGGRFVLCRHRAIAEATVEVLKETNLFGELDETFAKLSRAAIIARQKGTFVPDLHRWDYFLPDHFSGLDQFAIAIACSEGMQEADPLDMHLRVNLSKIYRAAERPNKAVLLFREFDGEIDSRIAWHEWAVAERDCGNTLVSLVLSACSVCDLPNSFAPSRESCIRTLGTMASIFQVLFEKHGDPVYLQAMLVTAQIATKLAVMSNQQLLESIVPREKYALEKGGTLVEDNKLITNLSLMVPGVATLVDIDLILKGRIPRAALGNYDGLGSMLK
jgi:predicted phosphodiesterase